MNKFVVASLAAAIVASPAAAAPFQGAYAGVAATLDNVQGSGALEGFGANGVGGSLFAGYDMPLGNAAFAGVEGNIDLNTADALGIEAKWGRSEEHTSELQSLMRISYAVFCLKQKKNKKCSKREHTI